MKPLFNDYTLKKINRLGVPFVLAMTLTTAMFPFLSSISLEHPKNEITPFFEPYHLGKLFSLRFDANGVSMKKVVHEVLTPIPYHLNAIYKDGSHSFIAINDNNATTFVDQGKLYKNLYKLIYISSQKAVFFAYGEKMELRLGENGYLKLKESVTSYIPDNSSKGAQFTVARSTIDRYTENIGEIWKNIAINAVTQQDKIVGFRVDKIAQDTPFALLGIQKGDIITGLDNKPLDSYATVFSLYQSALKNPAIKITVIRNNQPKDLEYEISR